jgi:hypothetical protein
LTGNDSLQGAGSYSSEADSLDAPALSRIRATSSVPRQFCGENDARYGSFPNLVGAADTDGA